MKFQFPPVILHLLWPIQFFLLQLIPGASVSHFSSQTYSCFWSAFLDTFQFASSGCDSVTSFKYFIVHIVCLIYAMLCRCHWFWAHKATIWPNGKAHSSWLLDPFSVSSSHFEFFLSGTIIYYAIIMSYPCPVTELAI